MSSRYVIIVDAADSSSGGVVYDAWVVGEREQDERAGWEVVEELTGNGRPVRVDGWSTLAELTEFGGHTATSHRRADTVRSEDEWKVPS